MIPFRRGLFIFLLGCMSAGAVESDAPLNGDEILALVRDKLPQQQLLINGKLQRIAPNGHRTSYPIYIDLHWGASLPCAHYRIGEEELTITWEEERPAYLFSQAKRDPAMEILGTGVTWADLSFSFLWWPNGRLVKEERKLNRPCYVVEIPIPESDRTLVLWIEKNMGMMLETHTLDADRKRIRRMKIKSIKKIEGMWFAKDLEFLNDETGIKAQLHISDIERKDQAPVAGADPE